MFEELDTVILIHDIAERGLKRGDIGAVVHVYDDGRAYEVEFVDSTSGSTVALLTLSPTDIISINTSVVTPLRGLYDSLEHSALGGLYWEIEPTKPYMVGTASVVVNIESDRSKSKETSFNYQTL